MIISKPQTLFDDEATRTKERVYTKWEILCDDGRNTLDEFAEVIEEFLKFGKTYRIIIDEVI